MATPENKVKTWAWAKLKAWLPGEWSFSPMSGPFGRSGVPDRVGTYKGVSLFIEAKAESGSLTPLQESAIREITKAGALVLVLVGKDEQALWKYCQEIERRGNALQAFISNNPV